MDQKEKIKIYEQLSWDYSIPPEDIEAVLKGDKANAGHFTQEKLFIRLLETYPWFTVIQLFTVEEIQILLTSRVVSRLRSASLRKKYEFVRYRLQQIIPAAG
jgi:hypothetical protein